MTSAQPVVATVALVREPRASVLAAFQLVEDARYLGTERRPRRNRARRLVQRTVDSRRLARDLPV
ncbi:hypothetical protein GCM10027451_35370 [Geodermatophilus aquaeductus]|jgi:hypothetical protein|uniref:Uncharacterized protein n=1 Tax=Geodermatophilus aquaeductus TaxID=1564161 RepID=A0A521FTI1_9ACTN|nr:hypothetical protein [Geodermatophilus aquaeductus]SMO98811.1 hypothetical protein SAMN06273567_11481 [Geodermatophilus aquaeductus]